MESKIPLTHKHEQRKTVEQQANYEENHSLLLFERLTNPIILDRLVNNLYEDISTIDYSKFSYYDLMSFREAGDYLAYGEEWVKKDIRKKILSRIEQVKKSTEIHYTPKGYLDSSGETAPGKVGIICGQNPSGLYESALTKNIAEAHEKGHVIRHFHDTSFFSQKIRFVFDFNLINISQEEYQQAIERIHQDISFDEYIDFLRDYMERTDEIIERMSQVKNYFGMSGTEEFTQEHLNYAREYYVQDTRMYRLQIQPFFDAIVDDEGFVKLMNSLGI